MSIAINIGGLAVGSSGSYWTPRYYVSNAGNDANTGLSDAQAWQTIAKVNSMTFIAGDKIGFQKNGVWREQLTVPSSGDSSKNIEFGAYGPGALLPVIDGSDIITGFTEETGDPVLTELTPNGGFDANVTGFASTIGDLSWQEAAIGGIAHTAKLTAGGTSYRNLQITGKGLTAVPHTMTFDFYIPSTNVKVDGVRVREFGGANTWLSTPFTGFDAWHTGTVHWTPGYDNVYLYMDDGGTINCTVGDTIYFDNISVTRDIAARTNIWKADLTTNPTYIFLGGIRSTLVGSIDAVLAAGNYFWASNILYVYSTSDPDTAFSSVSTAVRNQSIFLDSKDYITLNNLEVRGNKWAGVDLDTHGEGDIFNNVNSYYGGIYGGFYMRASGTVTLTNCESSYGYGAQGTGFFCQSSGTYNITNCQAHYNGNDGFNGNNSATLNLLRCSANYNGNGAGAGNGDGFTHHSTGILHLHYCSAHHNYKSGVAVMNSGGGTMYNNTFYSNYIVSLASTSYGILIDAPATWIVKNNICYGHTHEIFISAVAYGDGSKNGTTGANVTSDYNLFYPTLDANGFVYNNTHYSFTNFKTASSTDAHSITGDPLFVSLVTPDFHLQAGSPAIGAGVDVGLGDGTNPNIGAL